MILQFNFNYRSGVFALTSVDHNNQVSQINIECWLIRNAGDLIRINGHDKKILLGVC